MTSALASALIWFAIFFMGHLIYFNINPAVPRAKFIIGLLLIALLGHLASTMLLLQSDLVMPLLWGWLTILCLFILYMPFYYAMDTSLSLQSLILVQTAPEQRYPVNQLRERFVSKNLVGGRLHTMRANGYLTEENGHYLLSSKGRFVARCFLFLKNLWKLGSGG
ncbi:MAG: hypothetical protein HYU99_03110 [Deltaproteobacteria bacterium]|nr:hypothetical protein [Deltaproteobacteria bacterium]